jgi:hypothetical protein
MSYSKILTILLLASSIAFYGCNSNAGSASGEATDSLTVSTTPTMPNGENPNPATPEPAQNAEGVWHYTCAKGCVGGAGAVGICATCGGPLTHNQGYHGKAGATPTTTATPAAPAATPPPTAEPAQNAAGVWHYTCAKGCVGGAGTAGTCAKCGGALTHNQTYHQ